MSCSDSDSNESPAPTIDYARELAEYAVFRLEADLSTLPEGEQRMIPLLIEAAKAMDDLFWRQSYGNREDLLGSIQDPDARRLAEIHYGPWDRLDDNRPILPGVGPKPLGANFYPHDISKAEFEQAAAAADDDGEALRSLYTVVERDSGGSLRAVPYSNVYADRLTFAAAKLAEAAALTQDPGLRLYLELRAKAFLSDDYRPSDMAWMEMKSNRLDVVIGPIESYEDRLYGQKAAFEAYILIKDVDWSGRLARYAGMLDGLQRGLPVPPEYKAESPGADSELNAYDAIYYAGDCNAGAKTIAINLPNDEVVQLEKGSRRLQIKNAMRAKFEKILLPIADLLIDTGQRPQVTFDAFFANTMFHEVAHGLGIKNTLSGKGSVREAMKDNASSLEEGKADILGLYMVARLHELGELGAADVSDNYVTFLAGIFRSIRFGASSAHGVANLVRFNFFAEQGAFSRDEATGRYRADYDRMQAAVTALSEKILRLQGDGDYDGAAQFIARYGKIGSALQSDLDRIASAGIPVDIVFEQGMAVL